MNTELKKTITQKIEQHIQTFQKELDELEASVQPIAPENSLGRISRMDAIQNQSVVEAALRAKKRKVAKLKIALRKVDQEGFGNCAQCGNQIQEGRLMFLPESDLCVRCASR